MRLLILSIVCLSGSLCYGQADSLKTVKQPVEKQVAIPGVDTPISGAGMTAQEPLNGDTAPLTNTKKRKGKTQPPSDPRSFGVSIPVGKSRKDTLRQQ